jgi:hypothetical protein
VAKLEYVELAVKEKIICSGYLQAHLTGGTLDITISYFALFPFKK